MEEGRELLQKQQYYADINEEGMIISFYLNEIHGNNIPETAITITTDEWLSYSQDASKYKLDGEKIRKKTLEEIAAEYVEPGPLPKTPDQVKIEQLENESALLAMELINTQIRLKQTQQEQAGLLLALIEGGVL